MKSLLKIIVTCLLALAHLAVGQSNTKQSDPFEHPFANPVDNPDLPRVLIIGDSISIGYTPRVRRLLDGVANVHRPTTNCQWSAYGDEHLEEWIGDSRWDVIHFNFGLWDWYGWKQEEKATPESYAANLESMVRKMKAKTGAALVFAMTTPPCLGPEKNANIIVTEERAKEFNQAAQSAMEKHEVGINQLYDVVRKERERFQRGVDDVHYTEEGRDVLAAQVGATIRATLDSTEKASPKATP